MKGKKKDVWEGWDGLPYVYERAPKRIARRVREALEGVVGLLRGCSR